jgi:hypothetical protein
VAAFVIPPPQFHVPPSSSSISTPRWGSPVTEIQWLG